MEGKGKRKGSSGGAHLAVNGAADRLARAEDLLDGAGHRAGHAAVAQCLGRVVHVIVRDVAVVVDCKGGARAGKGGG